MLHRVVIVLILFLFDISSCFEDYYNPATLCHRKLCNNAGICVETSEYFKCECLPTYYKGEFCNINTNLCASSPCRNGGTCVNTPGHYICICNRNYSGHDCSRTEKYPTGLHLIVHYIMNFNIRAKFMLICQSLGSVPVVAFIKTKTYVIKIHRWNVKGETSNKWHYSYNLRNNFLHISARDIKQLPYRSGYYILFDVTFSEAGLNNIYLNFLKLSDLSLIESRVYPVLVIQRKLCVPRFELNSCDFPESPLVFSFNRFANVYPRIRKRCNDKQIRGHWKAYNIDESVLLQDFGEKSDLLLKMPQYSMWFGANYPGLATKDNMYLLKLLATDGESKVFFRCYVKFESASVQAIISGGSEQQFKVNSRIVIDGSLSRDYNSNPRKQQSLSYEWKCASNDDPNNFFCSSMSKHSERLIEVQSSDLKLQNTYTVTLTVRSLVDSRRSDSTQQIISIQQQSMAKVNIRCVRNCNRGTYDPTTFVHLKATCDRCYSSSNVYKWTKNSNVVGEMERLIIYLSEKTETISVTIVTKFKNGTSNLILKRSERPPNHKCALLKAKGTECFTALQTHCTGGSKDKRYKYTYNIGNSVYFTVKNPSTTLYLPHDQLLEVKICDDDGNCGTDQLSINLKPLKAPVTLRDMQFFFENKNTSVRLMLENNNVDPALCIAQTLAKRVTNLQMAELIYDQYKDYEFPRLVDVDRIIFITAELLMNLPKIDYKAADFFGKQIALIFRSLHHIVVDLEIRDMIQETYVYITNMLVGMYHMFGYQSEEMARELLFYDNEDAFIDQTVEWPDFDTTVTIRMNAWLKLFNVMNKCAQRIGRISTQFHYPKEPPFIVKFPNAELKTLAIEDLIDDIHVTSDDSNHIKLPRNSLLLAQNKLGSKEILIQSIVFTVNPAWWFPSHWVPTTNVFSYNIYSNYKHIGENDFPIIITSNKTQTDKQQMITQDTLISNRKISIFRTSVPAFGVLLVHFTMTTAKLFVLLKLHTAPTLFEVWNNPTCEVVSTRTLKLTSRCTESQVAYLAVLAPDNFDEYHKPVYKFSMMIRQCAHWDFDNYGWVNHDCTVLFHPSEPLKSICSCNHLSTFAAREVPVSPTALKKMGTIKDKLITNWAFVTSFAILFSFLFALLWRSWSNIGRHNVIHVISREEAHALDYKTENTLIHLRTGGRDNARTTASILLDFTSERTGYCRVVIYQNPKKPQLISNSNCMTRISSKKLQLPAQLTIRNDGNGDYPKWYCREIQVDDLQNNLSCVYHVGMWIKKNKRYTITASSDETTARLGRRRINIENSSSQQQKRIFMSFYQWRSRYLKSIAQSYINWFYMQPILGPWRYDDRSMNGLQRTCVWVSKLAVSVCVVCTYYGRTTVYNYYDYFETSSAINILNILLISLICYVCGLLVDYTFRSMII